MTPPIRVLLVDDHALVRSGVKLLLEQEPDLVVVGEAATAAEGIDLILELRPDVTVMDITLPDLDGIAATRQVIDAWPGAQILALSMHSENGFLVPFLEAGGMGYLRKSAVDRQLVEAVREVARGEISVHGDGVNAVVNQHRPTGEHRRNIAHLSGRERQVLELTVRGFTSREIGEQLAISSRTVETYRSRIMEKLHLERRSELVEFALDNGLLG